MKNGAEVTAPIRKTIRGNYHESPIDLEHLEEEIGDVLWYIGQLTIAYPNFDMLDIIRRNQEKISCNSLTIQDSRNVRTFEEYQNFVKQSKRSNLPNNKDERIRFFCMGLIKEIGKLAEMFGEYKIDKVTLDLDEVKVKLGDTLWYLTAIADEYGLDLEKIAEINIEKTKSRYEEDGTVIASDSTKQDGAER